VRLKRAISESVAINDLVALPDLDDGAVNSSRFDLRLDDAIDLLQIRFAQARGRGSISRR
jgi:hypothetical protein